ncbi:hypothetical protein Trydic_g6989 [Trypoxylus dichotomus]
MRVEVEPDGKHSGEIVKRPTDDINLGSLLLMYIILDIMPRQPTAARLYSMYMYGECIVKKLGERRSLAARFCLFHDGVERERVKLVAEMEMSPDRYRNDCPIEIDYVEAKFHIRNGLRSSGAAIEDGEITATV